MGLTNPLDEADWDARQRADYQRKQRMTVIVLPCCGSRIEIDPGDGSDQYVTCINKRCPKRTAAGGARHLIAWSLRRTTIQSERPMPEL